MINFFNYLGNINGEFTHTKIKRKPREKKRDKNETEIKCVCLLARGIYDIEM